MMSRRLVSLLLCACAAGVAAADAPRPTAVALFCPDGVKIDGVLDDACWARAKPLGPFHVLGKPGETVSDTVVRVAYDRAWLYFGVHCAHPAMREVKPAHWEHDSQVHMDESIEIFIDPGATGNPYFHFKLNCANVKAEQRASASGARETQWNTPWLSAVRRDDKGWDAEIAIPLYVLASFGDLERTRLNVTRNSVVPEIDRQGVVVRRRRRLSSWSPVIRTFHEPSRFGALRGLRVQGLRTPFLAGFDQARIEGYRLQGDRYVYDVTLRVRGYNDRAGRVRLSVVDQPVSGKGRTVAQTLEVKGTQPQEVRITVPIDSPAQRTAQVVLTDAATGAEFLRTRLAGGAALDLMSAYLDRTFYTTESAARVICALGMPARVLRRTMLRVLDEQGRELARGAPRAKQTALTIPLGRVATGRHALRVRWERADGGLIFEQRVTLAKLPPKPGFEWKIDKTTGALLHDGKPFFPFGLLMAGITSEDVNDLKAAADAGFNTVVFWCSTVSPEEVGRYFDATRKLGLFAMGRIEATNRRGVDEAILREFFRGDALKQAIRLSRRCGATHLKGLLVLTPPFSSLSRADKTRLFNRYCEASLPRMLAGWREALSRPNCIGLDHFDEPCLGAFDQDEAGRDLYRRVHEMDGYHPVFLLYSSYIPKTPRAIDWCDAIGTDPYWVPEGLPKRNTPNFVSKITCWTRRRAELAHKMTWIVPMAEFWSGVHKRAILPAEQYCQTYLALIHGAQALLYFRYPIYHRDTWNALRRVAEQLRVLGPIVVAGDVKQKVEYADARFDPDKDAYPSVQAKLFRRPAGGYVLLAANSRPDAVSVRFTVSGLPPRAAVGRLFADAKLVARGGAFGERLPGYATRAYVLPASELKEPMTVRVAATPPAADAAPPQTQISRHGRAGKKNVLPNPSFEEASLPGWPDYYRPWYAAPRIGEPNAGWGQDPRDPYHGRYCLRIRNTGRTNGFYGYISPQNDRPRRYVFSIYLKGERDGMRVTFGGKWLKWKRVKLTRSWKRYWVSGVMPARATRYQMVQLRLYDKGLIWADAMQLEPGQEPTAFEE